MKQSRSILTDMFVKQDADMAEIQLYTKNATSGL